MRFMAGLLGYVFPEYQYTWLFPEFEETINLELGMAMDCCCRKSGILYKEAAAGWIGAFKHSPCSAVFILFYLFLCFYFREFS